MTIKFENMDEITPNLKKIDEIQCDGSLEQKYNVIRDNRFIMEEVIVPISKALKLPLDDVVEIFVKKYDGTALYESHAFAEQARMGCLGRKVDIDLGLCWISDFFNLIPKKEADLIRKKVVEDTLMRNKPYKEALEEGRKLVIALLKE
jgi:energy-converting hydrogenase A subunit M